MTDAITDKIRQWLAESEDQSEIDAAISKLDARLHSLVQWIESEHASRLEELKQRVAMIDEAPSSDAD